MNFLSILISIFKVDKIKVNNTVYKDYFKTSFKILIGCCDVRLVPSFI